ncbi:MAG: DUF192 domain-containing protein [Novosphingobium sp.]
MRTAWFIAGLVALAACSPLPAKEQQQATSPATRHSISGLAIAPLTITAHGKVHRFRVELARTTEEQAQGLMFRTAMGPDEGMIFPMSPNRQASFWMRNTVIPLDLLFIDRGGRVESIAANAVPYSEEPINSKGVVVAVLEINGGRAAQLGIVAGDMVAW